MGRIVNDQVLRTDHTCLGIIRDPVDGRMDHVCSHGPFVQIQKPVPAEKQLLIDEDPASVHPFGLHLKENIVFIYIDLMQNMKERSDVVSLIFQSEKAGPGIDPADGINRQLPLQMIRVRYAQIPGISLQIQQIFPYLHPAFRIKQMKDDKDLLVFVLFHQITVFFLSS